jgi:hypothetical protein
MKALQENAKKTTNESIVVMKGIFHQQKMENHVKSMEETLQRIKKNLQSVS